MNQSVTLRYHSQALNVRELNDILNDLWPQLSDNNSKIRKSAEDAEIDMSELLNLEASEAISVRQDKAGFDPATTAIIVSFAPVAAKITHDLWDKVLLPWILRHKGKDALQESK